MENLLLSFNVVAPLMVYMAIGYLLKKCKLISETTFTQLSQIVLYACVPALCCDNLRTLNLQEAFSNATALYMAAALVIVFILCWLIVPRFSREASRRGVLIHAIFRSNDGIFGLAVAATLLGEANIGLMVICVAVTIPLYNLLGVTIMEYYRGGKPNIGHILKKVVTNPIIIGCVVGVLLSVFHIDLPLFIAKPLSSLSAASAPIGFIALGGALSFSSLAKNRKAIAIASLFRLVVIPAAVTAIFYLLGLRGNDLLVGAVIFGAPSAMTVYPMACNMGGDRQLAGGLVAITSALSLITMFCLIFLLKQTGVA
jgi:hypothetical protein